MDQRITRAVEHYVGAGYPTDAAAVLLVEVDGLEAGVDLDADAIAEIGREHGATSVRLAATEHERQLLWKGRKTAFGAIAQIAPDYYLHDTVVPRARLADVLTQVYAIAERHDLIVMNVFHAGDGNLHPLLLFDGREPGVLDRVHAAGDEIVAGVARRRRGALGRTRDRRREAGVHVRDVQRRRSRPPGAAAARLRPRLPRQPGKGPAGRSQLRGHPGAAPGAHGCVGMSATLVDHDAALLAFAREVGDDGPVSVRGAGTRWELGGPSAAGTRTLGAPTGIVAFAPEEMTVRVRAGTPVAELHAELARRGQRTALPDRGGTVGGAVAVGENHPEQLGRGTLRASVLQVRYVSSDGRVVNGGGPTVKNVTGFDLPRLLVGSLGTLGLLAEVIVRTNPVPPASLWLAADDADPFAVRDALQQPGAVWWNGTRTWVLLEGHAPDVAAERSVVARLGSFDTVDGPPSRPACRWSLSPADLRSVTSDTAGEFVAVVGVGVVFATQPAPPRPVAAPIPRAPRPDEGELRSHRSAEPRARPVDPLMDLGIDPDELNTCVQCGLCLSSCPTFRVTGDETRSPRGRIALMREVQLHDAPLTDEVIASFETCVQCRGCEPACPSGVPYGRLMERTRETLAVQHVTPRWQRFALAPLGHPRLLRAGSVALGVAQRLHVVPKRLGLSARIPLRQPADSLPLTFASGFHTDRCGEVRRKRWWAGCICSPGA